MSDLSGVPVIVSPGLPMAPGHREVARRLVRHGMADVLEWLGEPVGPAPDELTHMIWGHDPVRDERTLSYVVFVSQEAYDALHDLAKDGAA